MTPRLRFNGVDIPPLADTNAAIEFGKTLNDEQRKVLLSLHKAMEFAALNARNLQDRVDFATIAQLWREAAETRQDSPDFSEALINPIRPVNPVSILIPEDVTP